jgi:hypothetical protein
MIKFGLDAAIPILEASRTTDGQLKLFIRRLSLDTPQNRL